MVFSLSVGSIYLVNLVLSIDDPMQGDLCTNQKKGRSACIAQHGEVLHDQYLQFRKTV